MVEHVFYCGVDPPPRLPKHFQLLHTQGSQRNIALDRMPISRRLLKNLPHRMLDLIDVATYIFSADRLTSRGGRIGAGMAKDWRRSFRMRIGVRDPKHWSQPEICNTLVETLAFLSDDDFVFDFDMCQEAPPTEAYFPDLEEADGPAASSIILFSGGLDSLSGALDELEHRADRIVLVTHHSASIVKSYQTYLTRELTTLRPNRVLSIPVAMTLTGGLRDQERTQRTRTFFYASIAGVAAALLSAPRVRFYENGVMSLNLPMLGQVVGTTATRSTHPRALADMTALLQSALDQPLEVDNPFHLKTKAEVLKLIETNGHSHLIDAAYTCSNVRRRVAGYSHCGTCVQCLHRRFGALAAGLEKFDGTEKYAYHLFEGVPEGDDRTMLLGFVESARRWRTMSDDAFALEHSLDFSRLPPHLRKPEIRSQFFDLHRRHGAQVVSAIETGLQRYKSQLSSGLMPSGSLLTIVVGDQPGARVAASETDLSPARPRQIHLMVDAHRLSYSVDSQPLRKGRSAVQFLSILAEAHAADTRARRKPEDFTFVTAIAVEAEFGLHPGALQKLVQKLRDRLAEDLKAAGCKPNRIQDVIQNERGKGYRLNPEVRLVAPSPKIGQMS